MAKISAIVQQLKNEHARLTKEIQGIAAALAAFRSAYGKQTRRRRLSAAARARIAAAQRARWAKAKGHALKPKRTISASGRRKIAAAQRARWAKLKAAKKKTE